MFVIGGFVDVVFVFVVLEWADCCYVDGMGIVWVYDNFVDMFRFFEFYVLLVVAVIFRFVNVIVVGYGVLVVVFVCVYLYDVWVIGV